MKPIWKNGKLTVELHKPDVAVLENAKAIGEALAAMQQEFGEPLADAVDAILNETETETE